MHKKSLAIVLTQAPSATSANQEALDLALAAASFDQDVALIFEGDAIYQLANTQEPGLVGRKNLSKVMKALPIYGIEKLYAFGSSDFGVLGSDAKPTILSEHDYRTLLAESDTVIRF